MPLPEGMPELTFAGVLSGRRVRLATDDLGHRVMTDADFVICGTIDPNRQLPEGPFGDHLGYYSLAHDFPVMRVDRVYHRPNAIWPITAVGRPPQEDTTFGDLIHELTGPVIPSVLPASKEFTRLMQQEFIRCYSRLEVSVMCPTRLSEPRWNC